MTQEGPELRDIHLPADPSWWPPAPGWWLIGVLLVVLLAILLRYLGRRVRQQRWMRNVRNELARIAAVHAGQSNHAQLAGDLSALLRRASLLIEPRAAALSGEAWLAFLDERVGGDAFSNGVGRVLLDAPFQRAPDIDAEALVALSARWLDRALAQWNRDV